MAAMVGDAERFIAELNADNLVCDFFSSTVRTVVIALHGLGAKELWSGLP